MKLGIAVAAAALLLTSSMYAGAQGTGGGQKKGVETGMPSDTGETKGPAPKGSGPVQKGPADGQKKGVETGMPSDSGPPKGSPATGKAPATKQQNKQPGGVPRDDPPGGEDTVKPK